MKVLNLKTKNRTHIGEIDESQLMIFDINVDVLIADFSLSQAVVEIDNILDTVFTPANKILIQAKGVYLRLHFFDSKGTGMGFRNFYDFFMSALQPYLVDKTKPRGAKGDIRPYPDDETLEALNLKWSFLYDAGHFETVPYLAIDVFDREDEDKFLFGLIK